MPNFFRYSTPSTISIAVKPNLERAPAESTHLPAPCVFNFARKPILGLIFNFFAASVISFNSSLRSTTITISRPIFCASKAVSMYSTSLNPLQMITPPGMFIKDRTTKSSGLDPHSRPKFTSLPNFTSSCTK